MGYPLSATIIFPFNNKIIKLVSEKKMIYKKELTI